MTTGNLRADINARVQTLSKRELEELYQILDEKFPQPKAKLKERPIGLRKGSLKYTADDFDHSSEDIMTANQEEANDLAYQRDLAEWHSSMLL